MSCFDVLHLGAVLIRCTGEYVVGFQNIYGRQETVKKKRLRDRRDLLEITFVRLVPNGREGVFAVRFHDVDKFAHCLMC